MCNWQSPNSCLVAMSPMPGATSTKPSFTLHFASPPLALRQADKSLPLNSTVASEGGSLSDLPAVTMGGSFLGGGKGPGPCVVWLIVVTPNDVANTTTKRTASILRFIGFSLRLFLLRGISVVLTRLTLWDAYPLPIAGIQDPGRQNYLTNVIRDVSK